MKGKSLKLDSLLCLTSRSFMVSLRLAWSRLCEQRSVFMTMTSSETRFLLNLLFYKRLLGNQGCNRESCAGLAGLTVSFSLCGVWR